MKISVNEKRGWVEDLIFRETRRFEEDTKARIDDIAVRRLDGRITGVSLGIQRREDDYGA